MILLTLLELNSSSLSHDETIEDTYFLFVNFRNVALLPAYLFLRLVILYLNLQYRIGDNEKAECCYKVCSTTI